MRRRGMSAVQVGLIALVVIVVGTFLGFTKDIPFTRPFEIKAVFESANSIRTNSPVRVAGVQVGKVKSISGEGDSDTAVLTLQIDKKGLPIHADATAKIRPRIFLEGNFFVDLTTGTPEAPELGNGDTLKVTQTATPVQLDQVLTALQDDTRNDLKVILDELGTALSAKPTLAQDRRGDPSTRGQTGAEAFNDAYDDIAPAERDVAIVNEALLGTEPGRDVRRLISGLARATGGLNRHESQLRDLVTNLSTTMGAFAAEQGALRQTVRDLGPTLTTTNRALTSLNRAFPPTRAFARDILPGVRETPAVIRAGLPWIAQVRRLVQPAELRGLARDASPASRDLAGFVNASQRLFPQADLLAKCASRVILPTGEVPIRDRFATGQPNYREFAYSLVGLAGESQNGDGNGQYVHFQPGGGPTTLALGSGAPNLASPLAQGFPGNGTQPKMPARKPAFDADTPCYRSARPDLNGPWGAAGGFGTVLAGPAGTTTPGLPAVPSPGAPLGVAAKAKAARAKP